MKNYGLLAILVLVFLAKLNPASAQTISDNFLYDGQLIRAECIKSLTNFSEKKEIIIRDCLKPIKDKDILYARDEGEDEKDGIKTTYSYQFLGKIGDLYIVKDFYWGGGSGEFSGVSALRAEPKINPVRLVFDKGFVGGDRCQGGIWNADIKDGKMYASTSVTFADLYMLITGDKDDKNYSLFSHGALSCAGTAEYMIDPEQNKDQLLKLSLREDFYKSIEDNTPDGCLQDAIKVNIDSANTLYPADFKAIKTELVKCIRN